MLKQLTCAASLCGLVLAGGPAHAIDGDPCSDISCDGDDCLTCWEEGAIVICEEVPKLELELICDIELMPQGLGLTTPQGPRELPLVQPEREVPIPQPDPAPGRIQTAIPLPQ